MEITIGRMKHSLAVATKMKEMAQQEPKKYPVEPDDAFVLGMLHDIGYGMSMIHQCCGCLITWI